MAQNKQVTKALGKVGSSLSQKEIKQIKQQTGVTSGVKAAAKQAGINIKGSGSGSGSSSSLNFGIPNFGSGFAPAEFDFQSTIGAIKAQGGIDTSIAKLNADAAVTVQRIQKNTAFGVADRELAASNFRAAQEAEALKYKSDKDLAAALGVSANEAGALKYKADQDLAAALGVSQNEAAALKYKSDNELAAALGVSANEAAALKYKADQDLAAALGVASTQAAAALGVAETEAGAVKYKADRDLEAALGVENIRAKGAIDLQGVVNAGLERVENIRGEYGLKGKMIDRGTSIYAGLVNAFNFS